VLKWHSWVEVAWCSCAIWHRVGWGGLLWLCRVACIEMRWPSLVVPCGMYWGEVDHWLTATWHWGGAHLLVTYSRVGPTCWRGPMRGCHVALGCWVGPVWCCHVVHPLSSLILYLLCFLHPVCTQSCYHLQVVPRVALIKSQPLINPFNLFLSSLNLF
jgi:hypothetical protein